MKYKCLLFCLFLIGFSIPIRSAGLQVIDTVYNRPLIVVGNWERPPFFFINQEGQPDGFGYEIITTILKRKHLPYKIKYDNWTNSKRDLASNKADVSCTMVFNDQLKHYEYGMLIKYLNISLVRRKQDKFITSQQDIKGLTFFVQKGSHVEELAHEAKAKCKLASGESIEEGIMGLARGKYDGIVCNEDIAYYYIRKNKLTNLNCYDFDIIPQEYRLTGNNKKLMAMMSQELFKMKQDGSYQKISDKWFPQPVKTEIPKVVFYIVGFLVFLALFLNLITIYLRRRIQKAEANRVLLLTRYKTIFENALVGIQLFNSNGFLIEANDIFCQVFGITSKKGILKQGVCLYTCPLFRDLVNPNHLETYSGTVKYDFDELAKDPYFMNGLETGIHYVDIRISPVYNESGMPDCIVMLVRDVTARVNIQKELEQEKIKAQTADRLKSEFLANISHEIRTPLNAIVGFSSVFDSITDAQKRTECLNLIQVNSNILIRLINDTLNLSMIESGAMEIKHILFNLTELFRSLHTSLDNPDIRKEEVDFLCETPYKTCRIEADYDRLAQLLTNFVNNAFKNTNTGYVKMGYVCENNGIKVYVEDTGKGIPEDKKQLIFERFAKLDTFKQGAGLGLAICHAIAKQMNGTIDVDSTCGKGSTFSMWWPCKVLDVE